MMQNEFNTREDQHRNDKAKRKATEETGTQPLDSSKSNTNDGQSSSIQRAVDPLTPKLVIMIDIENMPRPKQLTPKDHLTALTQYFRSAGPGAPQRELSRIILCRGLRSTQNAGTVASKQLYDEYRAAGAESYTNMVDELEAADTLLTAHLKQITLNHVEVLGSRVPLLIVFLSNDKGFSRTFAACIRDGHQVVVVHAERSKYSLDVFRSIAPDGMQPPICIPHEAVLRRQFPTKLHSTSNNPVSIPNFIPLLEKRLSDPPKPTARPKMSFQEENEYLRACFDDDLDWLGWD
ncbi:hypothetical protein BDR26DRAFT_864684 [Obelidium mucronatum]|nr:hypothetical protein BDR26DRAFT_864684 [Obelidium mucronatum]